MPVSIVIFPFRRQPTLFFPTPPPCKAVGAYYFPPQMHACTGREKGETFSPGPGYKEESQGTLAAAKKGPKRRSEQRPKHGHTGPVAPPTGTGSRHWTLLCPGPSIDAMPPCPYNTCHGKKASPPSSPPLTLASKWTAAGCSNPLCTVAKVIQLRVK